MTARGDIFITMSDDLETGYILQTVDPVNMGWKNLGRPISENLLDFSSMTFTNRIPAFCGGEKPPPLGEEEE